MDLKSIIYELSEVPGASGAETPAAEKALELLKEYCPDAEIINGNVIGKFGKHRDELPSIVLDAHIDQIGMIVTYITESGFLKVGNLGGIDRRLLPSQPVVIHGREDIKGVVCSVPPHLIKGEEKIPGFDNISIDTGMSKAELVKLVSPGDSVTFDVKCHELCQYRFTGGAFDDRCGAAAILYALELLKDSETKYNVTVVFSAQEELGERGAKIAAFQTAPDMAIAVDVSFAYAEGENREKCGILGNGAMIGISPCLSTKMSEALIAAARSAEIPFQLEVMNGLTSTNADQYSVCRKGSEVCTVSIPIRNMHTPVEILELMDVKNTGLLLAEFLRGAEK